MEDESRFGCEEKRMRKADGWEFMKRVVHSQRTAVIEMKKENVLSENRFSYTC